METVLSNLTEDEATALVHFGADKTHTWLMVRLPAPEGEKLIVHGRCVTKPQSTVSRRWSKHRKKE